MASVMDVLNRYRSKAKGGAQAGATGTSMSAGGGAIQRNIPLEEQRIQQEAAIRQTAAGEAVTQELEAQQMQQENLRRQQEITELGQVGQAEKQRFEQAGAAALRDLEMNFKSLSSREKLDKMEIAAANLRLNDEKYRYNLEDVGRRERLQTAQGFEEAMQKAIFEDEIELLRSDINFKNMLNSSDASFQKQVAEMSIDTTLAMARQESKELQTRAMRSGAISGVSKGIGSLASNSDDEEPDTTTNERITTVPTLEQRNANMRGPTTSIWNEWE